MPTLTVTVELPEEAYRNAIALPAAERERRVAALFATASNLPADDLTDESTDYQLTPEDLAAIGRGIAESDAGMGRDGDSLFAEIYAKRGWSLKK